MTIEGYQTRARLLTAARDHYLEVGPSRFSLREVARRAHVSATAVYRHYDDKQALLREACAEGMRIFESYLARALAAPTARARMLESATQYLRFALHHPHDHRFLFMGTEGHGHERMIQLLVEQVRECVHARGLSNVDPMQLATIIWSHLHGLVSLRLSGHLSQFGDDAELFLSRAAERVLDPLTY